MTILSKDARQSELLDRLVLDFDTTEIVGRVKKLWLDVKSNRVKGLTCAHGTFNREKHSFSWDKVVTVGHDSILVKTEEREEVEPESIDNVIGLKVWTDAGNKVGRLADYCIDTTTGTVTAYLFTSNGWRGIAGGTYILDPDGVITVGSKRIIVAEASIQNAQQYEEGLTQKIQHAKQFVREDIAKSRSDFGVAVRNTQKAAERLQTKAHHATEVAKDKLSNAAKQLQHKSKQVSSPEGEILAESEARSEPESDSAKATDERSLYPDTNLELDREETSGV
ncbi:MAG: PRC-barrel domain-containing protein [Pleurocapsa sp. MO_226.B13]|nr:PRC-barrel domain-containing protein [Pleurocapsa sp. MO_226.B13]